ncbi:hypothetical protein [Gordonia rubripertincta]|uniref:Uncharacterized protein n=1 Tax=Gordonia rubripertincta TaxID=36822 RepID=A0ABT4MT14_GORRU|nr:hypothetical protein [Gordonia rubripertincta]MCZ4550112.1 hypothetical protein [Gordonia rubripertincta]
MTPMYGESGRSRTPSRVIWLEEPLLRDVRELLATTVGHVGPAFTLIDLDENGLRGAAVDAATGQCLIELNDHTLQATAFDRAIADYLVRVGKAQMPESAEWARELLDLMPQARMLLSTSPGTFLMGKQHVGLLRVTRADLDEALGASIVRAISLARSVSIASPLPVTAAVVMPNHTEWPGLLEALGAALAGAVPPAMAVAPLKNPHSTLRPSRHARPSDDETATALPLPATHLSLPPQPQPQPQPPGLVSAPQLREAPVPRVEQAATADRRKQNRLVLVGAALLSVLILVGGATLVTTPWRDDTTQPQSQRYLTTPDTTAATTTTTTAPSSTPAVPPINTSAALAPVVKYTTPPPPPPPTTRRPAPRPRQNTIPNPIPGQPPIVLP